jgi:hypothetical protein
MAQLTNNSPQEHNMSAKESKVTPAQREANGDSRGPHEGHNGSTIDPASPANGAPHLSPDRGNGDSRRDDT